MMKDLIDDMNEVAFEFVGDGEAIYNKSSIVKVKIEKDVVQFGKFDTNGPVLRHEVEFLVAEISDPKRGHTIETADATYTLDGSISNDGYIARWHINEG